MLFDTGYLWWRRFHRVGPRQGVGAALLRAVLLLSRALPSNCRAEHVVCVIDTFACWKPVLGVPRQHLPNVGDEPVLGIFIIHSCDFVENDVGIFLSA
jgi:hypothetical protein